MSRGKWKIKLTSNGTIDLRSVQNMKLSTMVDKCIEMGIVPKLIMRPIHLPLLKIEYMRDGIIRMTNLNGYTTGHLPAENYEK